MANRNKLGKIINHRKQLRENKAAEAARRERVRAYEAAKRRQRRPDMLRVVFQVIKTGSFVEKTFYSEYLCRKFVNKLRHSKCCRLVTYPNFR